MSQVQNSMCPDHLASGKPAELDLFSFQNRNEDMSRISMVTVYLGHLTLYIYIYYGSCIDINFKFNT